jgi:SAM-dependent methyltransferase
VDLNKEYNNDASDFALMSDFYELDLTLLDFDVIPDNHFDIIYMSHIIEHLHNGDQVIIKLLPKCKPGGLIYIEWPSIRSIDLPSKQGTLNFYDDGSHVRLYPLYEILNVLGTNGCTVLEKGVRRRIAHILFMPFLAIRYKILSPKEKIGGGFYWDYYRFADYAIARKR